MSQIDTKLDAAQVVKQAYDESNKRIRVDAQVNASISDVKIEDTDGDILEVNPDGSTNVNILNDLELSISAASGDNIAIESSSGNELGINADGSINANVVDSSVIENIFDEVTGVANGIPTEIISYTLSSDKRLEAVFVSGTNTAVYELLIDSVVQAKRYTYFGSSLNAEFDMRSMGLSSGQTISVVVTHSRPDFGAFNSNIILKEIL
jgi:hypothetical protein